MSESFKYDKRILKNPKLMENPLSKAEVDTYISELQDVQDQGVLISELFAQREEAARLAEEEAARLAEELRIAEEARLAEEAAINESPADDVQSDENETTLEEEAADDLVESDEE